MRRRFVSVVRMQATPMSVAMSGPRAVQHRRCAAAIDPPTCPHDRAAQGFRSTSPIGAQTNRQQHGNGRDPRPRYVLLRQAASSSDRSSRETRFRHKARGVCPVLRVADWHHFSTLEEDQR